MLRWFIRANTKLCNWIEGRLPRRFTRSLLYQHELTVARLMNERQDLRVLDIGGGHLCPFARHRKAELGTEILACDILEEQVRRNHAVDGKFVADATRSLPLAERSVDIVATRSVMEHLTTQHGLLGDCSRIVRTGGYFVSVFPCRYAPFAVLNRALPNWLSKRLLSLFFKEWDEECGFRAHYADCFYPRMPQMLARYGFEIAELHLRYYQAIYFRFFVPLYLLVLGYDLLMWALGWRRLACQMLVVARLRERAAPA